MLMTCQLECCLSFLFLMTLLLHTVTSATCDQLRCLNSNPCQSTVSPDNATHARCLCGGKWAGRRCQHELVLKLETLTSTKATLKVELITSKMANVTTSKVSPPMPFVSKTTEAQEKMNYTLVYWTRTEKAVRPSPGSDSSLVGSGKVSCVLLRNRKSRQPLLDGLWPQSQYTICIENGFVDSCALSSLAGSSLTGLSSPTDTSSNMTSAVASWPSNCVTITTPKHVPQVIHVHSSAVTNVVAVSVVVFVAVVVVAAFAVYFARRHSLTGRLLMDDVLQRCCCCRFCRKPLERTYISQFPAPSSARNSVNGEDLMPRQQGTVILALLRKLMCCTCRKKPSLCSSNMSSLLPAASSLPETLDYYVETSPLNARHGGRTEGNLDGLMAIETDPSSLHVNHNKPCGNQLPKNRLSGNRYGYVTYSTKKDVPVQLTTVLESPSDEEVIAEESVRVESESSESSDGWN